jgi:hypothetical protein
MCISRAKPSRARCKILLRIGDRLTDETGEYEIIGRPHTNAGKDAHARVRKVGQSDVTFELRTWGAYEKVSVKRATAEEGKR